MYDAYYEFKHDNCKTSLPTRNRKQHIIPTQAMRANMQKFDLN